MWIYCFISRSLYIYYIRVILTGKLIKRPHVSVLTKYKPLRVLSVFFSSNFAFIFHSLVCCALKIAWSDFVDYARALKENMCGGQNILGTGARINYTHTHSHKYGVAMFLFNMTHYTCCTLQPTNKVLYLQMHMCVMEGGLYTQWQRH